MSPSSNLRHRRTHNILLISKLLSSRDHASPLTLVLDTLEQPAKPVLNEYLRRAKVAKTHVVFLSFETFRRPAEIDVFVACHNKSGREITELCAAAVARATGVEGTARCLVFIDSLFTMVAMSMEQGSELSLPQFLSGLIQPPRQRMEMKVSLVAVYHSDVPLSLAWDGYASSPLSLLMYLATTVLTVHSLPILLAEKAARERSLAAPMFGLAEEVEGVLVGLKPSQKTLKMEDRGVVLELEHRRKSGRGVKELYFLPTSAGKGQMSPQGFKEQIMLLDDHPLFRKAAKEEMSEEDLAGMTFELGLTERQRLERDGVVLPYFDAQKGGDSGEGGRIVYEMGAEDDFDEEEDEI